MLGERHQRKSVHCHTLRPYNLVLNLYCTLFLHFRVRCVVLHFGVKKLGRCVQLRAGRNAGARARAPQTSNPTPRLRWTAHWVGEKPMRRRAAAETRLGWVDARQCGRLHSSCLLRDPPACLAPDVELTTTLRADEGTTASRAHQQPGLRVSGACLLQA